MKGFMNEITYSLRNGPEDSDPYYMDAAAFAGEVMSMTDSLAGPIVEKYMEFRGEDPRSDTGSKQEHCFEFLVLGTLWQVYSGDASGLDNAPRQLLSRLSKLRGQGGAFKPGIDFIRGIMSTLFLSPGLHDNDIAAELTRQQLGKLLDWLDATGEFNREVERLRLWQSHVDTLDADETAGLLGTALTLAAWFEESSLEALGRYTANVDKYLNEVRPGKYWHEDVIFCGRRRVEYHLNMVGAEIMNGIFREDFLSTEHKAVILPACMRSFSAPDCKASYEGNGLVCRSCSGSCAVNRITALGRRHGFKVFVIPHESSLSSSENEKPLLESNTGVVGIACVLNLVSGGWMMRNMGIPVQCVLLDYCGCRNHWSAEGIPTGINMDRLIKILGI